MLPDGDGDNINGPSLIRAPDWLPGRLARYYLYFAHHQGSYIRLAFADRLEGPWRIHAPGTLRLSDAPQCHGHIASPDVHVDEERREIRMYFHGPSASGGQKSFVAQSPDGLSFTSHGGALGAFYFRALRWNGEWFAMAKGGLIYRSAAGLTDFTENPKPAFPMRDPNANAAGDVRHVALQKMENTLFVYYSVIGHTPESILRARIDLNDPPERWIATHPETVLQPERPWEGTDLPAKASRSGAARSRENAVRDPAIYKEDDRVYLLYSVAGESGIAIAELQQR